MLAPGFWNIGKWQTFPITPTSLYITCSHAPAHYSVCPHRIHAFCPGYNHLSLFWREIFSDKIYEEKESLGVPAWRLQTNHCLVSDSLPSSKLPLTVLFPSVVASGGWKRGGAEVLLKQPYSSAVQYYSPMNWTTGKEMWLTPEAPEYLRPLNTC